MNDDQLQKYSMLNPELQSLYSSEKAALFNKKIKIEHALNDFQFTAYLELTGNVLVGVIPLSALESQLREHSIPGPAAKRIMADFIDYIGDKLEAVTGLRSNEPETVAATTVNQSLVTPLRTMEDDVDKIHGYGTYRELYPDAAGGEPVHQSKQDDALGKNRLADTPTYQ